MYETYLQNEREFEKIGIFSAPIPQSPDGLMTFVADISAVKSHNRLSLIKVMKALEKELEGEMFVQPEEAGQFGMHADGFNQGLEEAIDKIREFISKLEQV